MNLDDDDGDGLILCSAAAEFLDSKCMELVEQHLGFTRPIQPAKFYTLVETSGSHDQHDKEVRHACMAWQ